MTILRKALAASVVLLMGLSAAGTAADVAIIVSPKNALSGVTPAQVADIFLGRTSRFPDGSPAMPCDLPEGSATRDEFYSKIAGKSAAQVKAYWSKLIFTGRGQLPREVASNEEAKKLVAENPRAVCYIDKNAVDRSVNVLFTR